jgi:ABC-type dipeptide/oligopeptide/nickel transport system permease component
VLLAAVAIASGVGLVVPRERGLRASYVALVAALAFVSAPVWAGVVIVALGFAAVHGVPARAAVPG